VTGGDAESAHPVDIEAALLAVEGEVLKLAFEIGLHLQELEPEHLGFQEFLPTAREMADSLEILG
jgi:hypothetical protein